MIEIIKKKDYVSPEEARKQAIAALVPGVILQPSAVFAALHAQDVGCKYLRASYVPFLTTHVPMDRCSCTTVLLSGSRSEPPSSRVTFSNRSWSTRKRVVPSGIT